MTEMKVAKTLVKLIQAAGFEVVISDDELGCTDIQSVKAKDGEKVMAVFLLVWGNDPSGEELIADYGGQEIADQLYEQTMGNCGF